MRKTIFVLLVSSLFSVGYASKLSKFLKKMDEEEKERQEREWRQDMNFGDFVFRLDRRYTGEHGQQCRDYKFRSRSNPYRHGYYTVCDER